jgi:secreted trypsin-like serine protease
VQAGNINKQIVGGDAASRGQFPWQVSIYIDSTWLCGGSLIQNNWVITATHCTYNRTSFNVRMGSTHSYYMPAADIFIMNTTEKYEHPNYDHSTLFNDVTLLKLPQSITPNGKLIFDDVC